jgi:CheY-like chemotaxis protein
MNPRRAGTLGACDANTSEGDMPRIVIAEDDPDTRELICCALRPIAGEVREAASGLELLELIAHDGPFDLIVTDLAMPQVDGVRAIAMVRNAGVHTPILLVTAYPPESASENGLTSALFGNVQLVRKPFALAALREAAVALMT